MYWNYRMIRRITADGIVCAVHEVYYEDGKPVACTMEPVKPFGETEEELIHDMELYAKAASLPMLDYSTIGG